LVPGGQKDGARIRRSGVGSDGDHPHRVRFRFRCAALDGTWQGYKRETGRWRASRTDFADAIHFVGWYHYNSHRKNGIALNDAYSLYLAYYAGQAGYARGVWRGNAGMQKAARKAATMANSYDRQMRQCGR
jgi:hypothetical protein